MKKVERNDLAKAQVAGGCCKTSKNTCKTSSNNCCGSKCTGSTRGNGHTLLP